MSHNRLSEVFSYLNSEQSRLDGITTHDYCILTAVANYIRNDGTPAYPSLPHLCQLTRLSRRAVQRSIAKLEQLGRLTRKAGEKPHGSTRYALALPMGAHQTPMDDARGVPQTPLADARGVPQTPPRGVHQTPNPGISYPGKKDKMRVHAPEEKDKQARLLDWLGVTPDSDVWRAGMNGYLTATTKSSG